MRLTHWGIAAAGLVNALVTGGGGLWHVSVGWLAMAMLVLRLVWGGLGPAEARFSAFPPNPRAALLTRIYSKAGVSGPAQFAAVFVEDLLGEGVAARA